MTRGEKAVQNVSNFSYLSNWMNPGTVFVYTWLVQGGTDVGSEVRISA